MNNFGEEEEEEIELKAKNKIKMAVDDSDWFICMVENKNEWPSNF